MLFQNVIVILDQILLCLNRNVFIINLPYKTFFDISKFLRYNKKKSKNFLSVEQTRVRWYKKQVGIAFRMYL